MSENEDTPTITNDMDDTEGSIDKKKVVSPAGAFVAILIVILVATGILG